MDDYIKKMVGIYDRANEILLWIRLSYKVLDFNLRQKSEFTDLTYDLQTSGTIPRILIQ